MESRKQGKISWFFCLAWLAISFLQAKKDHPSVKRMDGFYQFTNTVIQIERPWMFDNGILFTYNGQTKGAAQSSGSKIYLSGSFFHWQKKIKLIKNDRGIYQVFLSIPLKPGKYLYRFQVNGLWVNDQEQPYRTFDRNGETVSYFILTKELVMTVSGSPERVSTSSYRFFLKDNHYQKVYWVSSLRGWNLYDHPMQLQDGYWVIEKNLDQMGLYFFLADGKKKLDVLNLEVHQNRFGFEANLVDPSR